jgi:hypothetical protein
MNKNKLKKKSELSKKRGKLLSTYIVILLILSGLTSIALFDPTYFMESYPYPNEWLPLYLVLINIATLVLLYGLWKLKKWAVYLTAVTMIVELFCESIFAGLNFLITNALGILIIIGITFYLIFRRWKFFT